MAKQIERRYKIERGMISEYYIVEVGMDAEFEAWLDSHFDSNGYEGLDYLTRSLRTGHWTFTDPRMG
jgi:hypothetical protein